MSLSNLDKTHFSCSTSRDFPFKNFYVIFISPECRKERLVIKTNLKQLYMSGVGFMEFNTTFNNISVISWQSVLSVEETRVPGENHTTDLS
jgi:hypothetical protein